MTERDVLRVRDVGKVYVGPDGDAVALEHVDLTVQRGATVAVVGPNGAGKSTLLRLIAGITEPTVGSIERARRTIGVIELGAGFEPELSGRDNLDLALALHGQGNRARRRVAEDAISFSGVGTAIDRPVKQYSAGMVARLAMAAALHSEPELLLVDEVLTVGDTSFQRRSLQRIGEMVEGGCALVLVTHQLPLARRVADRAVWIDDGRVIRIGASADVVADYERHQASIARIVEQDHTRLTSIELEPDVIRPGDPLALLAHLRTERPDAPLSIRVEIRPPIGDDDEWMLSRADPDQHLDLATIARSASLPIGEPGARESRVRVAIAGIPLTSTVVELHVVVLDAEGAVLDELGTNLTIREGDVTTWAVPQLLIRAEGPLPTR